MSAHELDETERARASHGQEAAGDDQADESHPDETYVGNGLYASFDGYAFTLRALRPYGDCIAVLEPSVLANFLAYVDEVKNA